MQIVNGEVVPQVTSWVEAWALKTTQHRVVPLAVCDLGSLINICSVVNTIWNVGIFEKTRQMKHEIYDEGESL